MGLFTGFSVISGIELIYWIWFKVTFEGWKSLSYPSYSGCFPQKGPSCPRQWTRSTPTPSTLLWRLREFSQHDDDAASQKGASGSAEYSRESKKRPRKPTARTWGTEVVDQDEQFLWGWQGLRHRLQTSSNDRRGGWRRTKRRAGSNCWSGIFCNNMIF